jgi:secreted trypsin-like serine protease
MTMMRLSTCFVRIATAATVLMAACTFAAGTARAISGGTESSDPNGLRRHVVRIVGSDGRVCSGTIIGPTKIVTAAHCFTSADPSLYRIMVLDHRFNEHWMSVAAIRIHPKFDRNGLERQTQLNDIAVVKAASPLPADMAVAPLSGGSVLGEMTAAGFGSGFAHGLRQAQVQAGSARLTRTGSQILTSIDGGACSGDSGGPVFRRSGNSFALVGVISWTSGPCGSTTAVTPVGRYRSFIGG